MSMIMLECIRDRSQYHPNINRRESRYKIYIYIYILNQAEWKRALLSTQNMGKGKGLHNVFNAVVNKL